MIDQYFTYKEHRTDLAFRFFIISENKKIDAALIDELKASLLSGYRTLEQYQFHVEGLSEEEIKEYVRDYVIPPDTTILDLNVRQGDWGEVLAGLMVTKFQGLAIPISKLQWKINKSKSVFGTDLIAFNAGDVIEDIYYYEIKTRLTSHKKEGSSPHYNYISILAHNSLLKDENLPNEMIADFLMRLFVEKGDFDTAKKFSDIVKNPKNYNRKFELFFIVEEDKYSESIFEALNDLPPTLSPLCVTVIIIKDLKVLINDTWSDIEDRLIQILKA